MDYCIAADNNFSLTRDCDTNIRFFKTEKNNAALILFIKL